MADITPINENHITSVADLEATIMAAAAGDMERETHDKATQAVDDAIEEAQTTGRIATVILDADPRSQYIAVSRLLASVDDHGCDATDGERWIFVGSAPSGPWIVCVKCRPEGKS